MGDITEMMLDGTICECCGEYIDDDDFGIPRYCSDNCAEEMGETQEDSNDKKQVDYSPLSKKLLKRLKLLSSLGVDDSSLTPKLGQSMYAGDYWDDAVRQYEKLEKRGFVEQRIPHNLSHKTRAVITQEGLDFLSSQNNIS